MAARRSGRRAGVIARLWRTAERQVAEIETRLRAVGGDPSTLERDAKTLSILAGTVRNLLSLDAEAEAAARSKGAADDEPAPRDLDAFRRELAQKLAELGALEPGD